MVGENKSLMKMDYLDIDPTLEKWAKGHGLYIGKDFRDDEVRTIDIVDDAGNEYGIYISPPNEDGEMAVNAAAGDPKKNQFVSEKATILTLEKILEKEYGQIAKWLSESGQTRTPVL